MDLPLLAGEASCLVQNIFLATFTLAGSLSKWAMFPGTGRLFEGVVRCETSQYWCTWFLNNLNNCPFGAWVGPDDFSQVLGQSGVQGHGDHECGGGPHLPEPGALVPLDVGLPLLLAAVIGDSLSLKVYPVSFLFGQDSSGYY